MASALTESVGKVAFASSVCTLPLDLYLCFVCCFLLLSSFSLVSFFVVVVVVFCLFLFAVVFSIIIFTLVVCLLPACFPRAQAFAFGVR